MRFFVLAATAAFVCSLVGCTSDGINPNSLSQAQLNAIETREVDASVDETFSAASNALFDAGYTIAMSDRQGGLITGTASKDNSAQRMWVSPYIRDTHFTLSVQVRALSPTLSAVRVKTAVNGQPVIKKEAIDHFWTLMQRQVLMKTPIDVADSPAAGSSANSAARNASGSTTGTPVKR